jgi:dihydroxy-acid dehydratase
VLDGDKIHIDIDNHSIKLLVSDEEIEKRRETMTLRTQQPLCGYLKRYAKAVQSADKGAVVC